MFDVHLEVYEREELDKLSKACDAEERLWFEFFWMTGMREQEVMHCSWEDVSLSRGTVTVHYKPEYGFSSKNYKEREIPIPAKLVKRLKTWKARSDKTCGLVFPTGGCKPDLDLLDCLKTCAERAKLNKGKFWLHKLRSTFATWSLWAGGDLRTVQQWLGHSRPRRRYYSACTRQHQRCRYRRCSWHCRFRLKTLRHFHR